MVTILCWIFGILLGIVLLALVFILVLLHIRVRIEAVGATGAVSVEACYGPIRVPLYPKPRHLKKKKDKAKKQPEKTGEKDAKKSGKGGFSLRKQGIDLGEIAGTVRDVLSDLTDRLHISRLRVRVLIGTEDAAHTGILLGQASAFTGMMIPFLENTFDMRDYHVSIDADFDADHTEWAFTVHGTMRPIEILRVLLRHRKPLRDLYHKLFK